MAPGSILNQVHLAERFGVSRVPVREALRRLEAEGLVSQAPHKRARVASVTDETVVNESLEIREAIEPVLMRCAIRRIGNDTLEQAADVLRALNNETDIAKLRGMHANFHAILYGPAQRPQMTSIIRNHRYRLDADPSRQAQKLRAFMREARRVHANLLKACRARNTNSVIRCVREEATIVRRLLSARE